MEKKRKNKTILFLALIISIITLTIAFSMLSNDLIIKGVLSVDKSTWDIKFDEKTLEIIKSDNIVYTEPTINKTSIDNIKVTLSSNDDFVIYKFDIVNNGTVDAYLDNIIKKDKICNSINDIYANQDENIVCSNINYSLTYDNNLELKKGDELLAGEKKKIVLKISYDGTNFPEDDVYVNNLGISLIYLQK